MRNTNYQIGAYYFPNYHVDPRNEAVHGPAWTEWDLVRRAEPRWEGHQQPKVPLWGHEDEADPQVMAKKIDAAADHALNHWIFDWYYYNDGPFLNRPLDEAFLNAPNNHRLKFALMWANHNWTDIHPAKRNAPRTNLYPGAVTRETFDGIVELCIERYFKHPSYWLIDGCPYFSVYDLMALLNGLGGVDATRTALDHFRARVKAAGFPDLHLNVVVWSVKILDGEERITNPQQMVNALGFDSISSYVWIHHVGLPHFPETPYEFVAAQAQQHWRRTREEFPLPFHPNVTMGWDSSARTVQSDVFDRSGYPFMETISGNTPELFEKALRDARSFLDEVPDGPKIISLNAWIEWSEGSYLEPDEINGLGYLEAVKRVFGS